MLSLASGSKCDVCYEAFGKESKAPCSTLCGHIFCSDCIPNISDACPLCRSYFNQDSCIKLHVDVDSRVGCSPDDLNEADELRAAIVKMAEEGTDEVTAKQQMQDTKQFLARHPKDQFKDLRILTRMFLFMCETKTHLRIQRHQNDVLSSQLNTLSEERADLMKRLAESEEARKYERDTALAVEKSLREHNALAVRNYTLLIQAYNKLAQSTAELLKQPQSYPSASSEKGSGFAAGILHSPIKTLLPTLDTVLEGVAVRDSESSLLISPLPQFTGVLPSLLDGLNPLPELTEDLEGEEKEDDEEEISTPDSIRNGQDMEGPHEIRRQPSGESLGSRPPDYSRQSKPSGLTRTAPHRRTRSRSIPSSSTSLSTPPSVRSASASPPTAPPHHLVPTAHIRPSSYPHNSRDSYSSPPPRLPDGDALRSRLHAILSDTSSSLPNTPSHPSCSPSAEREVPVHAPSTSPPTNRNEGAPIPRRPTLSTSNSTSDGVSHLLASGSNQQSHRYAPTPSPVPFITSQRYSSASSEAKKHEEERRRRLREERYAEMQRDDRERYRDGEGKKHRDDRHGADYERPPAQVEHEHSAKRPSSRPLRDQSASQNCIYPGASNSPSLRRRPSSGNTYGQPSAVPPVPVQEHASGHHGRHAGGSYGHRSKPVPIPTHTARCTPDLRLG